MSAIGGADLASMVATVYTLTNRPDMVAETTLAVQSATLKAHRCDYLWKDLFETVITYNTADYTQSIDYRSILPNFRSMKYLRKFDFDSNYQVNGPCFTDGYGYEVPPTGIYSTAGTQEPGAFFDILTPEQVLDSYKLQRRDVYYMAGNLIQVKSSTLTMYNLFACYLNPTVATQATYSSWIAADHPYAIIFDAVSKIQGLLGNDVAAKYYADAASMELQMLIGSNIIGEGY